MVKVAEKQKYLLLTLKSTSSENRSTANYFHLSESSPNYFSEIKVVSKYNTASTANVCTHQKQQIFEITRHISRFYTIQMSRSRPIRTYFQQAVLSNSMRITFFTSGCSKIMINHQTKQLRYWIPSGYVLWKNLFHKVTGKSKSNWVSNSTKYVVVFFFLFSTVSKCVRVCF